jgi:hypothetical protein
VAHNSVKVRPLFMPEGPKRREAPAIQWSRLVQSSRF